MKEMLEFLKSLLQEPIYQIGSLTYRINVMSSFYSKSLYVQFLVFYRLNGKRFRKKNIIFSLWVLNFFIT